MFGLYSIALLRSAWLCDDAYITLRTVDNWIAGYGLRWNVAERVQAYTHPLWMLGLTLSTLLLRDIYFAPITLSIILSLSAVWLARISSPSPQAAIVGAFALLSSKAFVDYSSSGLENPLSHLLLALFYRDYFKNRDDDTPHTRLWFIAGLAVWTRMDTLLFYAPALVASIRQQQPNLRLRSILCGCTLPALWMLFSLLYYGSPLPNTAFAKLNTGIARSELWQQGYYYLLNSWHWDPPTLVLITCGIACGFSSRKTRPLALGIVLYVAYVFSVGGDFMSGRFFSAAVFASVWLISRWQFSGARRWLPAASALAIAALVSPNWPPLSGSDYGLNRAHLTDQHRIADERGHYYQGTGLLSSRRGTLDEHPLAREGRAARASGISPILAGNIGLFGYYAGPAVHIIDGFALADPLLCRLPIRSLNWRIGHFVRDLPDGYEETLRSGHNRLRDARLQASYELIRSATRAPLFSPQRLRALWQLNTGTLSDLLAPLFASRQLQQQGHTLLQQDRAEEAIPLFFQSIAHDSTRAASWHGLARAHRRLNALDEAVRFALQAIAHSPDRSIFHGELVELGTRYAESGNSALARALYAKALSFDSGRADARLRLAQSYEAADNLQDAIAHYRIYVQIYPQDAKIAEHLKRLASR